MRKFSLVFVACVLAATTFMGCASVSSATNTVADATMNTWYTYAKNVDVDLGTTDNSATDAKTSSVTFANTYVRYTSSGLTVVMEQNAANGSNKPLRATKTYTTAEFGSGKWTALVASGKIVKSDAPASITNASAYTDVSEVSSAVSEGLNGGVQWKKLLANQLLSWLE